MGLTVYFVYTLCYNIYRWPGDQNNYKEVLQLKTEVINIGVPIKLYIEHSNNEIKEMVIKAITERRAIEVDEQPIKYVTMPVRLPKATAKAVRQLAEDHKLPITKYTCKLLEGVEFNEV